MVFRKTLTSGSTECCHLTFGWHVLMVPCRFHLLSSRYIQFDLQFLSKDWCWICYLTWRHVIVIDQDVKKKRNYARVNNVDGALLLFTDLRPQILMMEKYVSVEDCAPCRNAPSSLWVALQYRLATVCRCFQLVRIKLRISFLTLVIHYRFWQYNIFTFVLWFSTELIPARVINHFLQLN